MKHALSLFALVAALPAFAETTRELDAHEHGVGTLGIAIDGTTLALEFHAPGADIVGFEYEAESDADLAKIATALEVLSAPLSLFVTPDAAECAVRKAHAELEGEDEHGDEDHDDKDHDDHAEDGHDKHEEHADEDHDNHNDHVDEAGHTEFHAEYTLTCQKPEALTAITFNYFDAFPNAKEVEVQMITSSGANAYEIERDAPVLKLEP